MLDAEAYVYALGGRDILSAGLDHDVSFSADIDVAGSMETLPWWTFNLTGDGQIANGDGLWTYTLTLSIFGEGMDAAKADARSCYDIVHNWDDDPQATVLELDGESVWVSSLEDIDLFSRQSSAVVDGRNLTQYVGSFALALRNQ